MADFVTNLTGSAEVEASKIKELSKQLTITAHSLGIADQFATIKEEIDAESISFDIYDTLAVNTTPLSEREDVGRQKLTVGKVTLAPAEHGDVVTTTKLASLQTGGKTDLAAPRLVGINMMQVQNKLACLALDAATNVIFANGKANADAILAADVYTDVEAGYVFNRLSRESIPGLPQADNKYVILAHDDVIEDMKKTQYWKDATTYATPEAQLLNEVGMFKGQRVVRENFVTIAPNAGAVKVYNTYHIGFNAFGKAISKDPQGMITGPFDALGRFTNVGWYGVVKYGVVDNKAVWVVKSASSVG